MAKAIEFSSMLDIALETDDTLNNYDLISTYLGSALFGRLRGDWLKIIVLRDPVARLRSSYWHHRSHAGYVSPASPLAKSLTFRDFLASRDPAVIRQCTNAQTWTVLGDKSLAFRERYQGVGEDTLLQKALDQLADYSIVGFTENLDQMWAHLCGVMGAKASHLPKLRAQKGMPALENPSPCDEDFHTTLDRELVERASDLPNAIR